MSPAEVLTELLAAGVVLTRHGDRLRLAPPQAVPPLLLAEVRKHKSALLELVGEPGPLRCFTCRGRDFWRATVHYADGETRPGPWVCRRCHPAASGTTERDGIKGGGE
jgi:hypothetical protein